LARARSAFEAGADLIELDVWRYRGRLEVRHTKTMGRVPLLWDRWSLAPGWGPRLLLDELLDTLPPGAGLMLDLKGNDRRLPAEVLTAVDRRPRTGAVAVCSQNWALVDELGQRADITAVHSIGKRRRFAGLLEHLRAHEPAGQAAISIHRRLLTTDSIRALRELDTTIVTWPVNDAAVARTLTEWGIDGLISDDVDLVRKIVAQRG
jgi:glycerophosphoryl diester phosphodiesterase